jgi:anti-anti-sigma regulatory factor
MTLTLPQALTIVQVVEFRKALLAALEAGGDLELDAGALQETDVAGLQLLEATHRSAVARGLRLRFTAGGRGVLDAAATGLGLRLAADRSLWREVTHG